MPKMKTHSGAKKRFKLTAKGKVRARHAFSSHILEKKSPKRKRRLGTPVILSPDDSKRVKNVVKALKAVGLEEPPDRLTARTATQETDDRRKRGPISLPSAPPEGDDTEGPALNSRGMVEATFGDDQLPASELWDKDRSELLEIDGISDASVDEIYRLRAEHMQSAAATAVVPHLVVRESSSPPSK